MTSFNDILPGMLFTPISHTHPLTGLVFVKMRFHHGIIVATIGFNQNRVDRHRGDIVPFDKDEVEPLSFDCYLGDKFFMSNYEI